MSDGQIVKVYQTSTKITQSPSREREKIMKTIDIIRRSRPQFKKRQNPNFIDGGRNKRWHVRAYINYGRQQRSPSFVNKIITGQFWPQNWLSPKDDSLFARTGHLQRSREYDPSYVSSISNARGGGVIQTKRLADEDITTIKKVPGIEQVRLETSVNLN